MRQSIIGCRRTTPLAAPLHAALLTISKRPAILMVARKFYRFQEGFGMSLKIVRNFPPEGEFLFTDINPTVTGGCLFWDLETTSGGAAW